MSEIKKLPDSELEAMLAIWQSEQPVAGARLFELLAQRKGWSQSTVFTLLLRLTEKGFIKCEKQVKKNLYTEIVSEKEYRECESQSVLDRFYAGSIKNFLAGFCTSKELNPDEILALRNFVQDKYKEE